METEQEKVTPFYSSSMSVDAETSQKARLEQTAEEGGEKPVEALAPSPLQTSAWTRAGKPVEKWAHLDNFLKKNNKVLLDKLAIDRERERLQRENNDLQAILKQYFDGVSVNDAVLKSSNPLFVINGRVNLNQPLPVRRMDHALTIVDGNHMVELGRIAAPNQMPL